MNETIKKILSISANIAGFFALMYALRWGGLRMGAGMLLGMFAFVYMFARKWAMIMSIISLTSDQEAETLHEELFETGEKEAEVEK